MEKFHVLEHTTSQGRLNGKCRFFYTGTGNVRVKYNSFMCILIEFSFRFKKFIGYLNFILCDDKKI